MRTGPSISRAALASVLVPLLAMALAPAAAAQEPTAEQRAQMQAAQKAYDAMPDTPGTGPYPAIKEVARTLPGYVIYRPADLSAVPAHGLGVIAWGNGGCSTDGASARLHLAELASHGYVVVAPGKIYSGPRAASPPPPEPNRPVLFAETTSAQVMAGAEWVLAENAREGSALFGLIDPAQLAVSGHSCGGVQAIDLASDPRVKTAIIHNSGLFPEGTQPMTGLTTTKRWLDELHAPILYIQGGPDDVAYENGMDDFRRITTAPVAILNNTKGHGGTFQEPEGGIAAQAAVRWLAWQLRGHEQAGAMFTGPDCTYCTDAEWTFDRRNFPK